VTKVEDGSIESFRPQRRNLNKHSQRGMGALEASMRKHGYVAPMTAAADGEIIDGSARLETVANVFEDDVLIVHHDGTKPVVMVRDDIPNASTNEARAISALANRIAEINLTWDAEELFADFQSEVDFGGAFNQEELDAIFAGLVAPEPVNDTPPDVSKADELQKKWQTSIGQLWQLGKHRLAVGDCTDAATVTHLMQDEVADIAFTSPPYNLGNNIQIYNRSKSLKDSGSAYNGNEDDLSDEGYLSLLINFTDIALLHSRYAFVNIQSLAGNKVALIEYQYHFKEHFADVAIWHKTNQQPAMANNVMNSSFEYVLMFGSEKNPSRAIKTGNFRGTFSNVYTSLINTNEFSDVHGAAFPVEFAGHFIQAFTSRDGLVLEPFNGTGTTLIACEQLSRQCRAIELDAGYCAITLQRFQDATGIEPILINEG
jgi:DNA modification methylase